MRVLWFLAWLALCCGSASAQFAPFVQGATSSAPTFSLPGDAGVSNAAAIVHAYGVVPYSQAYANAGGKALDYSCKVSGLHGTAIFNTIANISAGADVLIDSLNGLGLSNVLNCGANVIQCDATNANVLYDQTGATGGNGTCQAANPLVVALAGGPTTTTSIGTITWPALQTNTAGTVGYAVTGTVTTISGHFAFGCVVLIAATQASDQDCIAGSSNPTMNVQISTTQWRGTSMTGTTVGAMSTGVWHSAIVEANPPANSSVCVQVNSTSTCGATAAGSQSYSVIDIFSHGGAPNGMSSGSKVTLALAWNVTLGSVSQTAIAVVLKSIGGG